MSVTIYDIPAETVGFKPKRTLLGKFLLFVLRFSGIACAVLILLVKFYLPYIRTFETEAFRTTVLVAGLCFYFSFVAYLIGNWSSTTDKDGKTYANKLQEFYAKIPGRDALTYERVSSYKTFPNTEQDEGTDIETLSFGSATLHRRKKILRGLKNVRYPKNISIAEEKQASGLPDRLKLIDR